MTEEQFKEACFFFDQANEVYEKLLQAHREGRMDDFNMLAEQHRLLRLRHKRIREGYYDRNQG